MRYYVLTDPHGYFAELDTALREKGFYEDRSPHKLIICGDLLDRGKEAVKVQEFVLELMARGEVILIRGNHEDLMLELLQNWHRRSYKSDVHKKNKTLDTVFQLTGTRPWDLITNADSVAERLAETPYLRTIIPATLNYYEIKHYIFTHGWIPCHMVRVMGRRMIYSPLEDWRHADEEHWGAAHWINGMEAAYNGMTELEKTIVCGHWHTSFGHARYEGSGGEFQDKPNFAPYYAKGIIALDGCVPLSHKVNCIILED